MPGFQYKPEVWPNCTNRSRVSIQRFMVHHFCLYFCIGHDVALDAVEHYQQDVPTLTHVRASTMSEQSQSHSSIQHRHFSPRSQVLGSLAKPTVVNSNESEDSRVNASAVSAVDSAQQTSTTNALSVTPILSTAQKKKVDLLSIYFFLFYMWLNFQFCLHSN